MCLLARYTFFFSFYGAKHGLLARFLQVQRRSNVEGAAALREDTIQALTVLFNDCNEYVRAFAFVGRSNVEDLYMIITQQGTSHHALAT